VQLRVEKIERPLEVPPTKRNLAWCRETLREEEKHVSPSGTFRESNDLKDIQVM
jgi:hypothetical protein